MDVIDEGLTGYIREDRKDAVDLSIKLDRDQVWQSSNRWSWNRAWHIFRDNLIPIK
jgi:hypothetical protein